MVPPCQSPDLDTFRIPETAGWRLPVIRHAPKYTIPRFILGRQGRTSLPHGPLLAGDQLVWPTEEDFTRAVLPEFATKGAGYFY